jgi:hypothetical protein
MPDPKTTIKTKLEEDVKKSLNISTLTPEITKIINDTATEVAGSLTKQNIQKKAIQVGKGLFREGDPKKAITDRLSSALVGIKLVSQSPTLQEMLDENAKMLFAKKTALIKAGFTADEAFQLILAEVSAKKAK